MLQALISPIAAVLDKVVPDAGERAKLAHEIATLAEKQAHEIALAQIEVNKVEASSSSLLKSGWRPSLGWVCSAAFAYHFVGQPMAVFVLAYFGVETPPLPNFDMASLLTVLGGLLGLGSLRTFEKCKGVAK